MSRSTSPLAKVVSGLQEKASAAAEDVSAGVSEFSQSVKQGVNKLTSDLAGGPGSGLGPSPTIGGGRPNETFQNTPEGIQAAIGEGFSTVQNKLDAAGLDTLADAVPAVGNIASDLAGNIEQITGGDLGSGIQGLAGTLSNAAGTLDDILSLKRGANLPAGGELFQSTGQPIEIKATPKNDWRVRINCQWSQFNSPLFSRLVDTGGLVWPYLPQVQISTTANYNQIDPVHTNYPLLGYKNSQVDDITITGEFSAENSIDAEYWIAATTFLKTATKMFYGSSNNVGNPPIICQLSGYGASIFNNVPVVITNFNVQLNEDVNYVKYDETNTWVPVLSTISVTCKPIYSRSKLRQFSLQDYAAGKMTTGSGNSGQGLI
jgi:hypothetical protein